MKSKNRKRPKLSLLHDEIPEHVHQLMQLTRLAEMGRLASNVAHELNNPLMVIQGFAENIEMLLVQEEQPRAELRLQIQQILKSCQRMSRIITKMNRMSREQKLRLHVVDLAEVALNAVDFMRVHLDEIDARLEFCFDHPLPIQCDAVQVEQIVLNILSNAAAALGQKKGERKIRISFDQVVRWNLLKIWNNGPAMPDNVQSAIMTPFFTTKPTGEGAGLGLSVSKAIMQVHGGDLSFSSDDKRGTEFVLSFPRPKQNPWQQQARQSTGRVFVIDRQSNYRRTLEEKFRLLGFKTSAHEDYASGFTAIQRESAITGVFVNIVPDLRESLTFIQKLRRRLGPTGLIFVMSNFPSARDYKAELKAAGATEFFEKPIHADNFTHILHLLDSAAGGTTAAPVKAAA